MMNTVFFPTDADRQKAAQARRFLLWLYIGSTVMIFAGLTSALVVSMADIDISSISYARNAAQQVTHGKNGSWKIFSLPDIFLLSTVVILLSSLSFHWAYRSARRNDFVNVRLGLLGALIGGVAFLTSQYIGYQELYAAGVYLVDNSGKIGSFYKVNNVSGSFFYVITGMHGLHIIAGLLVLTVLFIRALQYKIHAQNMLGMQLAAIFWHALDFIWVYLFVFLSIVYSTR